MRASILSLLIFISLQAFSQKPNPVNKSYSFEAEGQHTETRLDGSTRCMYTILNGNLVNERNCYHRNGTLMIHEEYKDGKFNGINYTLNESGDTTFIEHFKNDTLMYARNYGYYKNGAIKQIYTTIYENDSTLSIHPFINLAIFGKAGVNLSKAEKTVHNHGVVASYYENGRLQAVSDILNGEYTGKYIEYYESGKLKIESGIINNQWNGKYVEYTDEGKIIQEIIYVNGKKQP